MLLVIKIILPKGNAFPKSNYHTNVFVQPPNEEEEINEDDLPLRWSVQKQKGSKVTRPEPRPSYVGHLKSN